MNPSLNGWDFLFMNNLEHNKELKANSLINSRSPYLKQHSYNPVQWKEWNDDSLNEAKEKNKPILVSIGYSACHWCHVMERESFENEQVAAIMNEELICIKIDREERPDIDAIYMQAVQAMGINGGWPLNVFLLPDLRPFYGGTYFPKEKWIGVIQQIGVAYRNHLPELEESAGQFLKYIQQSDIERYNLNLENEPRLHPAVLDGFFSKLTQQFDNQWGGLNRAPKFPLPSIWEMCLDYGNTNDNPKALEHTHFTLQKMIAGGIFDPVEGGFARYSVDAEWFAPHFEKMLYDNAQMLTILAKCYKVYQSEELKYAIDKTIDWLKTDMLAPSVNAFYSALDADSEGIEGKYYTYTAQELKEILGEKNALFSKIFSITEEGNFEHGRNILFRKAAYKSIANTESISVNELEKFLNQCFELLSEERKLRIKPGLDDKIIIAWNALTLSGLVEVYKVNFSNDVLALAENLAQFLIEKAWNNEQGFLYHTYQGGEFYQEGFLDDYASTLLALIQLYEITLNDRYISFAINKLIPAIKSNFADAADPYYFFASKNNSASKQLIAQKKELFDNVIPSPNSILARAYLKAGEVTGNSSLIEEAKKMLLPMISLMQRDISFLSNWGVLYNSLATPSVELTIIGADAKSYLNTLLKANFTNININGSLNEPEESVLEFLPILRNRFNAGKTQVYICQNYSCKAPITDINEAIQEIEQLLDIENIQ